MKNQELYARCQCCGSVVEQSKIFIKAYDKTAIKLCNECAKELQNDIKEYCAGGE